MPRSASVLVSRLLSRARLRHLQVLVKVAELGSLQKAAQAIGMTQPAVTHIIADLEALLEIKLFVRHARGVTASPFCEEIVPMARQIINAIGVGMNAVVARIEQGGSTIRIGAIKAAISGFLAETLARFNEQHPQIAVNVIENRIDDLLVLLQKGELDLIACREPALLPLGYRFISVSKDQMVVVCKRDHPLTRKKKRLFSIEELGQEEWVATSIGTLAREALDELMARRELVPRYVYITSLSTDVTQALLCRTRLLALTPHSLFRPALKAGLLTSIPLHPDALPSIGSLGLIAREAYSVEVEATLVEFVRTNVCSRIETLYEHANHENRIAEKSVRQRRPSPKISSHTE